MGYATVDELKGELASLREEIKRTETPRQRAETVFGTPGNPAQSAFGTSGPLAGSRRFSLANFIGNAVVKGLHDETKVEREFCSRFKNALMKTGNMLTGEDGSNKLWLPVDLEGYGPSLTSTSEAEADIAYVKAHLAVQPTGEMDLDELRWLARNGHVNIKAGPQSAFFDQQGGTLVAPPTQGPVIPLIRPDAACLKAGASSMPLPPSGRYTEPRITSAPDVAAVAESNAAPQGNLGTDQMDMQAKKITGYVVLSKESSLFTSGTQDQWVQSELNRSLGLKFDAYALYGSGGSGIPKGIVQYAGTGSGDAIDFFASTDGAGGVGTNGNKLLPQYGDQCPTLIEERSFGLDAVDGGKWIMRPATLSGVRTVRASAVNSGDAQGAYVDILRRFQENGADQWAGRGVVKSTNIRKNQSKGNSGTVLSDAFFGIWKYMVLGSYGAIQFEQGYINAQLINGQITVIGTMFGDVGNRYPAAFLWAKQLIMNPQPVS